MNCPANHRIRPVSAPRGQSLARALVLGAVLALAPFSARAVLINFEASGPYNTHPGSAPDTSFTASLNDSRGLYFDGDSTPISGAGPVPSIDVASRISTEAAWISGITGVAVSEPGSIILIASGLVVIRPFAWRTVA